MTDPTLSWLEGSLDPTMVMGAEAAAQRRIFYEALHTTATASQDHHDDDSDNEWAAQSLDLLAWDAIQDGVLDGNARRLCRQAFSIARGRLPLPTEYEGSSDEALHAKRSLLRTACLGWLGDETALAGRLLADIELPGSVESGVQWNVRLSQAVIDAWLLILRKREWRDIDALGVLLEEVRQGQRDGERNYIEAITGKPLEEVPDDPAAASEARPAAWELVWSYQMLRAAELTAEYFVTGAIETERRATYDPKESIQSHIERAQVAADAARSFELDELCRLLGYVAIQLIDNSIWSIARGANPLARKFVETLTSRDRRHPLLELLPPQRAALSENGLVRGGSRSIVVSLPTSSGKTLIAEFRMLQALNAFSEQHGWVAYVAPNRALVNQITRRLRRDFGPLGIPVERVSPALEVDGLEAALITDENTEQQFRVLVCTPEKLDLMLRSGWADRISRPLSLVVVDEAHNLEDPHRGIRLELLLATINREVRDAQFLLLTPFIRNAAEIAAWLDSSSNQAVQLAFEWIPNDRIIGLAKRVQLPGRGNYGIELESLVTSRETLAVENSVPLGGPRPLGISWSDAAAPGQLAAATASVLGSRGPTITLAQRPDHAWGLAERIRKGAERHPDPVERQAVREVVADEYGEGFALIELLAHGIGVHHRGMSDELRILVEWLLENDQINHLVATTTVAQGVNFPVANVVLASHQFPYGLDMPPADFWNLAGRAGRVDQGQVGIVALAAPTDDRVQKLVHFVGRQVASLNSTLVSMVVEAMQEFGHINLVGLAYRDTWSPFVQFLAHTYRQIGDGEEFSAEVERLLRGTFGFRELRINYPAAATELVRAVRAYAESLSGQPLSLVDATGFSWESVSSAMARLTQERIGSDIWRSEIYGADTRPLASLVGVMLGVPELKEQLLEGAPQEDQPGHFLAEVIRDWVTGRPLTEIADTYFRRPGDDAVTSMTRCCQRLFGKIAPTVAWGLSAMQSISMAGEFDQLADEEKRSLRNLPSFAFYGVHTEAEVSLRLLGVPRPVTNSLSSYFNLEAYSREHVNSSPLTNVRSCLTMSSSQDWVEAIGARGASYHLAWRILDGSI